MYRRSGRGRVLLLVFLALCIVLITVDFRQGSSGPLEGIKNFSAAVVAPVQRGFTSVFRPVGNFFSSLADLGSLRSENARLRDEVDSMHSEVANARDLVGQNEQLRRELDLSRAWQSMKTVPAEVISNTPSNYKWAVFIDKGSADGIKRDMAVISPDGLVGKVVRAGVHDSTVLLLIDPGAFAGARVESDASAGPTSDYTGVVSGAGQSNPLTLSYVNTKARVSVDENVVTRGVDGGVYPAGIPIGTVASVRASGQLDQQITVEPSVDFANLQFVSVLLETGSKVKVPKGF